MGYNLSNIDLDLFKVTGYLKYLVSIIYPSTAGSTGNKLLPRKPKDS
jgi:hypothetical protein